ncbi:chemotaxis protein CheY [Desulfonema ishimotonii]|uniref:Chemotaxis protein CheY n=1 Tax=Desulfonema ishimotonii TaxID=45657 RepID=A0A401FQ74_9BACT|nr:response regulator [Desulfonema ishimotonii]GBC59139.1 chemotaxis protein CheY [Desulfonema ishimotonii]
MPRASILVVEDSPTNMQLITDALKHEGYRISRATDGEEALEKAISEQPDLIVLDVILPKKNGFQVCRQLRSSPDTRNIKIIMLTSKSQESDRYWGLKQGADEYMIKPYKIEELLSNVAKLV